MLRVQIVSVPSFLYVVKKLELIANSSIIFFQLCATSIIHPDVGEIILDCKKRLDVYLILLFIVQALWPSRPYHSSKKCNTLGIIRVVKKYSQSHFFYKLGFLYYWDGEQKFMSFGRKRPFINSGTEWCNSYIKSILNVYRVSQNKVTFRMLLKPKNRNQSAAWPNFPMDMNWERLILLCL